MNYCNGENENIQLAKSRNIYSTLDKNMKTVKNKKGNANFDNIALKINYSTEKNRFDRSVIENRDRYP